MILIRFFFSENLFTYLLKVFFFFFFYRRLLKVGKTIFLLLFRLDDVKLYKVVHKQLKLIS